ncbi:MAG: MltA domain-containing protein [Rhodospirillaceae bacterium]|nr:MltA domain-containing protein [Rhodospirillaceae bacterium]
MRMLPRDPSDREFLIALALAAMLGGILGAGLVYWLRPPKAPPVAAPAPTAPQPPPAAADYTPVPFAALPGWADDSIGDIGPALRLSCTALVAQDTQSPVGAGVAARPRGAWRAACDMLTAATDPAALRQVLESAFEPLAVSVGGNDRGTFTGYYEATLTGDLSRSARFAVPLYGLPDDLINVPVKDFLPPNTALGDVPAALVGRVVDRKLAPYHDRAAIDGADAVADKAPVIAWVEDPVEAHILHIQGSGQVSLPDGTTIRVGFAGSNGRAFTGLGSILLAEGVLKPGQASMIGVRDWLKANPARAAELMNRNARYIFFRRIDGPGPIGAQGVPLTALRSLAVDPRFVPLGAPVWLDTADPDGVPLRRLMVAQDVGAAITGAVRGDVFWGTGAAAFDKAARMKSPGRFFVLVPRAADGR